MRSQPGIGADASFGPASADAATDPAEEPIRTRDEGRRERAIRRRACPNPARAAARIGLSHVLPDVRAELSARPGAGAPAPEDRANETLSRVAAEAHHPRGGRSAAGAPRRCRATVQRARLRPATARTARRLRDGVGPSGSVGTRSARARSGAGFGSRSRSLFGRCERPGGPARSHRGSRFGGGRSRATPADPGRDPHRAVETSRDGEHVARASPKRDPDGGVETSAVQELFPCTHPRRDLDRAVEISRRPEGVVVDERLRSTVRPALERRPGRGSAGKRARPGAIGRVHHGPRGRPAMPRPARGRAACSGFAERGRPSSAAAAASAPGAGPGTCGWFAGARVHRASDPLQPCGGEDVAEGEGRPVERSAASVGWRGRPPAFRWRSQHSRARVSLALAGSRRPASPGGSCSSERTGPNGPSAGRPVAHGSRRRRLFRSRWCGHGLGGAQQPLRGLRGPVPSGAIPSLSGAIRRRRRSVRGIAPASACPTSPGPRRPPREGGERAPSASPGKSDRRGCRFGHRLAPGRARVQAGRICRVEGSARQILPVGCGPSR